jgi:folate-binding protein YgfZ
MTSSTIQDKAALAQTADRRAPVTADSGDVRSEFRALLSGCGVYGLGEQAKITVIGSDRVRWLNGMVTNNVRDLAPGSGVYAFLLNPQGHILADLYTYNRGESLLVDTDQTQVEKVLAVFDKYIIMDDVEVANISDKLTAIGIAGPNAAKVLRAAGIDFPELQPQQFVDLKWQQVGLTVARGDNASVESFELWLAPETVASLTESLTKSGAMPVSATALKLLRIASGIPRYGQDIRERDLPQETEQARALNFTKGCYIGQEIVERIRSRGNVRRKFTGFLIEGPLPAAGSKLYVEGKEMGEITSAASLPLEIQVVVALGYIRREAATPGQIVDAGNAKAKVSNLPFAEVFKP